MPSTAEAITSIRSLTEEQGHPMQLRDVLVADVDGYAGLGFDVEQAITVPDVDERLVPNGILTGVLACRTVIISSMESKAFIGEPDVSGLTLIRARLTYDQLESEFSEGGEVNHTAVYTLRSDDGQKIDDHYRATDAYNAASKRHHDELIGRFGGSWNAGDEELESPQPEPLERLLMRTKYILAAPDVPRLATDDRDGMDLLGRSSRNETIQSQAMKLVQQKYPETRILSSNNHGQITRDELPLLAGWLLSQSALKS